VRTLAREAGLATAILEYVQSQPGDLQSKMANVIDQKKEVTRLICYWLAAAGSIQGEKAGSSYTLFTEGGGGAAGWARSARHRMEQTLSNKG
jgi:hypothetical protein